jgi:hypothetical protein
MFLPKSTDDDIDLESSHVTFTNLHLVWSPVVIRAVSSNAETKPSQSHRHVPDLAVPSSFENIGRDMYNMLRHL